MLGPTDRGEVGYANNRPAVITVKGRERLRLGARASQPAGRGDYRFWSFAAKRLSRVKGRCSRKPQVGLSTTSPPLRLAASPPRAECAVLHPAFLRVCTRNKSATPLPYARASVKTRLGHVFTDTYRPSAEKHTTGYVQTLSAPRPSS